MGKDLKGKELGVGITQQKNGLYSARFVDKFGKRRQKRFKKLQECRQWIADATYVDVHSNILQATDIIVDAWFDYWIDIHWENAVVNMLEFAKENDGSAIIHARSQ